MHLDKTICKWILDTQHPWWMLITFFKTIICDSYLKIAPNLHENQCKWSYCTTILISQSPQNLPHLGIELGPSKDYKIAKKTF